MDRQQAGEILKRLKLKVTAKRQDVICCLGAASTFQSAEEVWNSLKRLNVGIGLPTVYRILDELAAACLVTRIFMPDRKQYFFLCPNLAHHHHFVCESCRTVADLDQCGLDGLIDGIMCRTGARVTSHILQINGICAACAAEGKEVL